VLVAFLKKALAISYSYVSKELYSSLSLLTSKKLVLPRAFSSFLLRVYIMSLVRA
jgi:hypothetical protein